MTLNLLDKEPPENMGPVRVVFATFEVTNYDTSGEEFKPGLLGFSRIQRVDVTPLDGDVFSAGYDESTDRLHFDIAGGENVRFKMEVKGR